MVNINPVALCPQIDCGKELPTPIPDHCPHCGHLIKPPENPFFATPDYLTFQLRDYSEKYSEDDRDPDAKPLSPAEKKTFEEVKANFKKWLRECPTEDKLASLRDSFEIMRHVLYAKIDGQQLKAILTIGKEIGELAEAADKFMRSGGALYEPETRPVQTFGGDDGLSASATFRSGDTP